MIYRKHEPGSSIISYYIVKIMYEIYNPNNIFYEIINNPYKLSFLYYPHFTLILISEMPTFHTDIKISQLSTFYIDSKTFPTCPHFTLIIRFPSWPHFTLVHRFPDCTLYSLVQRFPDCPNLTLITTSRIIHWYKDFLIA